MSIRIILADDHAILRDGLNKTLEQEDDIEVVAQTQDGRTTVERAGELSPDVVLMDISMPKLNGIEATRCIAKDHPQVKVIILSMHSGRTYVTETFKAGASGYLLKDCSFDELLDAVRVVAGGKKYISPSISDVIVGDCLLGVSEGEDSAFSVLTKREREVVQLLAEGQTTKQVGRSLHISPKTVEVHRLKIMNKLNIDGIALLTKYALQQGLTSLES